MVFAISEVRGIVARACARPDVLHAYAQRDLGAIILVLKTLGDLALKERAIARTAPRNTGAFRDAVAA